MKQNLTRAQLDSCRATIKFDMNSDFDVYLTKLFRKYPWVLNRQYVRSFDEVEEIFRERAPSLKKVFQHLHDEGCFDAHPELLEFVKTRFSEEK